MTHYQSISKCRLCGSSALHQVFTLGEQPLTGVFRKPEEPDPIKAPLELVACDDCKFLQLKHTVDPSLMYSEYWYRSGINQTMRDHLAGIVADIRNVVQISAGDYVVDIGCNDGTLLSNYNQMDVVKIGVDPSDAIHSITDDSVIKVNNFFTASALENILNNNKAKVISSISMFYDLDNPHAFIKDIRNCLADDGVWVVEMNYTGNMIHDLGYDMVSHEHVAYYTLLTFEKLLKINGMYVNDAKFNTINGGSIRLFCGKKESSSESVVSIRKEELKSGLENISTFENFSARVNDFRNRLKSLIFELVERGNKIAAYGASTRGNTILQHCGFSSDQIFAAADRNPAKWGLVTPGTRIPIVSEEFVREAKPDFMLILPYGFLAEFLKREEEYLKGGGKIIVPLPELCVYSWIDNKVSRELLI